MLMPVADVCGLLTKAGLCVLLRFLLLLKCYTFKGRQITHICGSCLGVFGLIVLALALMGRFLCFAMDKVS